MENDRARAAKQSFALRSAHRLFKPERIGRARLSSILRRIAALSRIPCRTVFRLGNGPSISAESPVPCFIIIFTEHFHVNHLSSRFRNVFTLNSQYIFQQRLPANPLFSEKSAFNFSDRAAPAISFRARFFFDGKTRFLHRFVISRLKINDILICTLMMGEVCHVPNEIQPP